MNCNKCGTDINSLYQNERICKDCSRKRWNDNRRKRKERGVLKSTIMPYEYHSKYHKNWSEQNKDKIRKYASGARKKDPQKAKARDLLNKAVKTGKVSKMVCEICGNEKSEAHHEDYSKPLQVKWVCRKHHKQLHKKATE